MEPRILYSADMAGGLLLASDSPVVAEHRTLNADGEYSMQSQESVVLQRDAQSIAIAYAATPMNFERNLGQADNHVDFFARGSGYGIALSGNAVEISLGQGASSSTVHMVLAGGNSAPVAQPQDLQVARSNYLVGNNTSDWLTGIENYGAIVYQDVYSGVDVRYYGTQRQLEYDFFVKPGGNPDDIRLRFDGAQASLDSGGDLLLAVDGRQEIIRFKAPVSYQDGLQGREAVASAYQLREDGSIGFVLGDYDATRLLVIDPVLDYASYFGTTGTESALGVAVDSAGAVYITGRTTAAMGSNLGPSGSGDVYVAKFSSNLSTLIYSTRIGGSGNDQGNSIAVDAGGNASVTGWTQSSDFPTVAAFQGALSGAQDAFIFRLNAAGSGLAFSTFLGGLSATDIGAGIAVDSGGNVYATGQRSQTAVPVATGLGGASLSGDEAFIVKFDNAGSLQYSSFFGGNSADSGAAIAVDSAGSAYIVGQSSSSNLPMVNSHDTTARIDEGFIAKINAAGNSILYSSFIGGNKKDLVTAIAVDSGGKAYVTGQTEGKNNTQFSVTSGAFQTSNAGSTDAGFVRVYNTTLSGAGSLLYSSFLGGSISTGPGNGDLPSGIAIDSLGRAVIVGRTDTSNFPVTADAYSSTNTSSGSDGATFLVVLNPSGAGSADLVSGTFFGSASSAGSVAMSGGKAVFVGSTNTNGLATAGSAQLARAGGSDAIVVSFTIVPTANTAPVLSGGNAFSGLLEDPVTNPGTLVSTLIAGKVTDPDTGALAGVAVTGLVMTNGVWQYSLNGGTSWNAFTLPSSAVATLLNSDTLTRVRFVPNANFNGTVSGGMSFRAWDRTSGTSGTTANTTTNGGSTAFGNSVSSADITVTSVNDVPGRTGGTVANLTVEQDAGLSSLGLGALAYGPGGGSDEAAQTLTYTVTAVPGAALGTIVLADGTTVVSAASSYSLAQLQGMQFKTAAFASGGPAAFSWSVIDSGGGVGVLAETLAVKINSAPSPAPSPAPAPGPAPAPAVSASEPLATTPTQPEDLIAVPTVGSSSSIASNITQRLASSTAVAARGNEVSQSDDAFLPVNAEGAAVQTLTQSTGQTSISPGVVLTPAVFVSADRRAFTPAALPVVEPEFAQINFLQGSAPSSLLDVERGLRSPALLEQLDRLREEIRKDLNLEQTVAITAAGVTFGMSVVYVLWLIRGGVLLGSYLSALPAWQVLDPLPVLERIKNPADEDDDSFEEFENNASDPVNSLRGY